MKFHSIRGIVETAIRLHPPDCIFADGAVDIIVNELEKVLTPDVSYADALDIFEVTIRKYEIYCPYEGIDRRV